MWWTLCWLHDNSFLREEEGSISDKDSVNKMQIQVVMTTVDEEGGKGLLCWNFDEILFQHSAIDNNAWKVVLLACVIYKAFGCTTMILSGSYFNIELQYRTHAQYIRLRHSVHLVVALFDTLPNAIFNSYFNCVHACKP